MLLARRACTILTPGDSIWLKTDQGRTVLELEIRRPGTISGVNIDTIQFQMDTEEWAELADAATRRVRWGQRLIEEAMGIQTPQPETATLRDQFAMSALNGYLTGSYMGDANEGLGNFGDPCFPEAARAAYNYADAMMEARSCSNTKATGGASTA